MWKLSDAVKFYENTISQYNHQFIQTTCTRHGHNILTVVKWRLFNLARQNIDAGNFGSQKALMQSFILCWVFTSPSNSKMWWPLSRNNHMVWQLVFKWQNECNSQTYSSIRYILVYNYSLSSLYKLPFNCLLKVITYNLIFISDVRIRWNRKIHCWNWKRKGRRSRKEETKEIIIVLLIWLIILQELFSLSLLS